MTHSTSASAAENGINARNFQPYETRDQNLFNLIHGQALPTNARLHSRSQTSWSSSLIITNALNIDSNSEEDIYLDYEAYRFNLSYQYGLNADWNLKIDVPLIYQSGGVFDSVTPVPETRPDGSILLQFESCSHGTVRYDLPSIGLSGLVPIERLAPDNIAHCENLATKSSAD